ncbi:MAG: hypothetical protein ACRDTJ_06645, partial [Pseudonocardiaceae bacterium]
PILSGLGLLTGLAATGIGAGLVVRNHETLFGAVWSALMLDLGLIVLISCFGLFLAKRRQQPPEPAREVTFGNERAHFLARRANPGTLAANVVLVLLGGWFLVMGVVGGIEENWLWPVLAAFPAAYFLGFPVLWVVGLFRSGGVWLTETRIIDEHLGLRREIALANVKTAFDVFDGVQVKPLDPSAISYRRRTPRLWCARLVPGEMLIQAAGLAGGAEGLAAEVRERATAAEGEAKRGWWPWRSSS